MSEETPEQRIARIESELADAKISKLEHELADAKAAAGMPAAAIFARPHREAAPAPATPIDTNLAAVPRRVPTSFLIAELLPWSWWYAFTLLMVGVTPIVLWIFAPRAFPPVGIVALIVIGALHTRRARMRLALLRWGKVAEIVEAKEAARGTYYSGTTYNNMSIPIAHGWKVSRTLYSGPKIVTRVRYRLDGHEGEIMLGGRGFIDGVVLVHSKQPALAMCVTAFPYDLDRDASGNWLGKLRTGVVAGMFATTVLLIAWIGAIGYMARRFW